MQQLPRNILYITNGSIGDFLMALYFVDLVTAASPDTHIRIVTPRNAGLFREIAKPYIVSVLECNTHSVTGVLNTVGLLFTSFTSTIVSPLPPKSLSSGMRTLIGLLSSIPGNSFASFETNDGRTLYPDMVGALVKQLGFNVASKSPRLKFVKDDAVLAKHGLINGQYIVLHPCGSSQVRTLTEEEVVSVINLIRQKNQALKIVITGSSQDHSYLEGALKKISDPDQNIIDLSGQMPMNELINIIDGARLFIGVDTGITHVASMIGARSLVVSHAGSLFQWLPYYNPQATIIYKLDEDKRYFLRVPIQPVLEALSGMLSS